jgi:hypothetical protein
MVLSGFINCCLLLFTTEAAAVFRGPRTLLSSSNVLHQGDGFFFYPVLNKLVRGLSKPHMGMGA